MALSLRDHFKRTLQDTGFQYNALRYLFKTAWIQFLHKKELNEDNFPAWDEELQLVRSSFDDLSDANKIALADETARQLRAIGGRHAGFFVRAGIMMECCDILRHRWREETGATPADDDFRYFKTALTRFTVDVLKHSAALWKLTNETLVLPTETISFIRWHQEQKKQGEKQSPDYH